MREIKFRGKDLKTGNWVCGDLLSNTPDKRCFIQPKEYDMDPIKANKETVGQYTGLTDKNGTKIFEGDILRLCEGTYPCEIYWSGISWAIKRNGKRVDYAFGCDLISDCEKMQIIGNIYDNPELLKEN